MYGDADITDVDVKQESTVLLTVLLLTVSFVLLGVVSLQYGVISIGTEIIAKHVYDSGSLQEQILTTFDPSRSPSTTPSISPIITRDPSRSPSASPSASASASSLSSLPVHMSPPAIQINMKQHTLNHLVIEIANRNYSTFNDDIALDNITFYSFSNESFIRSLSDKTVVLYGDSTMAHFFSFVMYCFHKMRDNLCTFNSQLTHSYDPFMFKMMGEVNHNTFADTKRNEVEKNTIMRSKIINATIIGYSRYASWKNVRNTLQYMHFYEDMFTKYRPDVIYWNPSLLHLLHLVPVRPFETGAVDTALHFHQHLLKIYEMASKISAKCVIYRSASPICEYHDNDKYSNWRLIYDYGMDSNANKSHPSYIKYQSAMSQCYDQYSSHELCDKWVMNNDGIMYVNNMMQSFVISAQNGTFGNYTNVFYYDRFHLFHKDNNICKNEAVDSVHWMSSYGADAMFFTNFIEFACN